jgi:membrane-bound serine protease (ClpP class)
MLKSRCILSLLFLFLLVLVGAEASASAPRVDVVKVKGVVNPVLADYIDRGITHAEQYNAAACIIELDTPGGLLSSTEEIVNRILDANVPVVVYVSPWAGSAGTFITIAAHVAAMAPGSRIGAAHPVAGGGEEISETMEKKITEDTAAWIRSIAEMRGRNVDAAERTVREATSYTAQEALELNLIDLYADDLDQLCTKLEEEIGEVKLADGRVVPLNTKNAAINYIEMSAIESFILAISHPNIAYILMSLAMLGIMIELGHPGLILPGVVGGICLILAIYSLDILEANLTGILLIVLALGLFIAEIFTPTFGLLTAGGATSLVLGSLILFSGTPFGVDWQLIAGVVVFVTGILALIITAVVRGQRRQAVTGQEGLIGKVAEVQTELDPSGIVFVEGERWKATTEGGKIEPGEEVIVTKVDGLKLWVTRKSN